MQISYHCHPPSTPFADKLHVSNLFSHIDTFSLAPSHSRLKLSIAIHICRSLVGWHGDVVATGGSSSHSGLTTRLSTRVLSTRKCMVGLAKNICIWWILFSFLVLILLYLVVKNENIDDLQLCRKLGL